MNWLEYMDEDTFFHRLSPVTKIIWFVLISVLIAVVRDLPAVTVLFLFMAAVWVRAGLIDRMKMLGRNLFPIMGFAFVMWIVIGALHVDAPDTVPIYQDRIFCLEYADISRAVSTVFRIFLMVSVFYTLIITTNFSEIIYGLRKLHVPYPAAFGAGLVFQVIPNIIREFRTVVDAQRSRGLEVDRGPVIKRARRYCLVLVPLFIRILGTAQNITMSMFIYRLHLGSSRSSLKEISTKRDDLLFLGISILVFAGAGYLSLIH